MLKHSLWGNFLYYICPIKKKKILNNIDIVYPNENEHFKISLLKAFYGHLLKSFKEFIFFPLYKKISSIHFHGLEHLDNALANQRGTLIIGPHIGNWELTVPGFLAKHPLTNRKLSFIKKMTKNAMINRQILKRHRNANIEVIEPEGAIKSIVKSLKSNRIIYLTIDGVANRESSIKVPLFNKPAHTYRLAAQLHKRYNPALLFCYTYRESDFKQHFCFSPFDGSDDLSNETVQSLTRRYLSVLETIILKHPEQWLCWLQNRWKD